MRPAITQQALNLAAALALLFAVGCHSAETQDSEAKAASGTNASRQVFDVKGVIKEIRPDDSVAVIRHEEIPGYMKAMTMPFTAKNPAELSGLKSNDVVSFKLVVTKDDGWIEQLRRTGTNASTNTATLPGYRRARIVEPLKVGDVMPDYDFTNQLGQAESLASLKGRAVVITFIFTTCPFPLFCPKMSENFTEVQKQLQADPAAPKNWKLWSVTIDPEKDTPEVLKGYASRYKHDPAHWSFLTGDLIDITALGDQFGLTFWQADNSISHNLRTVVIDASGRVQAIIRENKWTPAQLVEEIRKAAVAKVE